MPAPTVHKATSFEDSGIILMARLVDQAGDFIEQADISAVTYAVYDKAEGLTDIEQNSPLTVSEVVFNTLQVPTIWTTDTNGYNFRYDVVKEELPVGDKTYRFEFKFTPVTGEQFFVVFEVATLDLLSS